jgi:hypothetical protein
VKSPVRFEVGGVIEKDISVFIFAGMEKLLRLVAALVTDNVLVAVAARKLGGDAAWLAVIVELPIVPLSVTTFPLIVAIPVFELV